MAAYDIEWQEPFSGIERVGVNSAEEVVAWLRNDNNRDLHRGDFNRITVRGETGTIDVGELMERANRGEPRVRPGFDEAERAMLSVLNDINADNVSVHNLDTLDSLRQMLACMPSAGADNSPQGI